MFCIPTCLVVSLFRLSSQVQYTLPSQKDFLPLASDSGQSSWGRQLFTHKSETQGTLNFSRVLIFFLTHFTSCLVSPFLDSGQNTDYYPSTPSSSSTPPCSQAAASFQTALQKCLCFGLVGGGGSAGGPDVYTGLRAPLVFPSFKYRSRRRRQNNRKPTPFLSPSFRWGA